MTNNILKLCSPTSHWDGNSGSSVKSVLTIAFQHVLEYSYILSAASKSKMRSGSQTRLANAVFALRDPRLQKTEESASHHVL